MKFTNYTLNGGQGKFGEDKKKKKKIDKQTRADILQIVRLGCACKELKAKSESLKKCFPMDTKILIGGKRNAPARKFGGLMRLI